MLLSSGLVMVYDETKVKSCQLVTLVLWLLFKSCPVSTLTFIIRAVMSLVSQEKASF